MGLPAFLFPVFLIENELRSLSDSGLGAGLLMYRTSDKNDDMMTLC
jgi:hypothetical protein